MLSEVYSMQTTDSQIDDRNESVLEAETRGIDFKGNVRYFCPRCNVRYIEFKYLKTHLKECGNVHKCDECQQKFKQKRTYVAHMKKKHGVLAGANQNDSIPLKSQHYVLSI
ncbi:hypothetical protein ACKWTF_012780 [Chironomus riparius]